MGKYDQRVKASAKTLTRPTSFLGRKDPPVRHLVLHFDVNQTIVLNDTVKNQTVSDVINYLLAEEAWGFEEYSESGARWVAMGEAGECLMVDRPSGSITYLEYLEKVHPGRAGKKRREQLAGRFTEIGAPGEILREVYQKLFNLALPAGGDASAICVLPAFYHFLVELRRRSRTFSVVFRSFGEDLPNLVEDFNAFCEGRKEGFLGVHFDGTGGSPDLRMTPMNTGSWFRAENDFVGLVWGDTDLETELVAHFKDQKEPPLEGAGSLEDFVAKENAKEDGRITKLRCTTGLLAVSEELRKRTDAPCGMALREYYPLWAKHDRHGATGKMVMVWRMDETRHDILFDDNIKEDGEHAGIADTVDVGTGRGGHRRLSLPYALRYHLVRANTLAILTEEDWFLQRLLQKEESFNVRYHARRGLRVIYPRLASVLRLCRQLGKSRAKVATKAKAEALNDGDNPQEDGAEASRSKEEASDTSPVVKLASLAISDDFAVDAAIREPQGVQRTSRRRSTYAGAGRVSTADSEYSPWRRDMDLKRSILRARPQSRLMDEREDVEAMADVAAQWREEAAAKKKEATPSVGTQVGDK